MLMDAGVMLLLVLLVRRAGRHASRIRLTPMGRVMHSNFTSRLGTLFDCGLTDEVLLGTAAKVT